MLKTIKITVSAFIVTAGLIKGAPAAAEHAAPQNVSIVQTADLDLSSKAGRTLLDRRLVSAAYEVCGTASDADLAGKNAVRACRHNTLTRARATSDQLASRAAGTILVAASR